jgi:hypothetical protein
MAMPTPLKDVTTEVNLVKWEDIAALFPDQPLSASSLSLDLINAKVTAPIHVAGQLPVEFSVDAGADFTVAAINGKNGSDEDGIIAAAAPKDDPMNLPPMVVLGGGQAWLKYRVEATVKADVSVTTGPVGFAGGAGAEAIFAHYRAHVASEKVAVSAAADIQHGPRFAVRLADVQALGVGDALLYRTAGTLTASVDLEWSDILTSEISALTRLLRTASPVAIQLSIGTSLKATVSVDDDFVVAFTRTDESTVKASVKKATVRRQDITFDEGITVTFADPSQISDAVKQIVSGLVGMGEDKLQELLDGASLSNLSDEQRAIVDDILTRLGLDPSSASGALKAKIESLTNDVTNAATRLAKAKLTLAFGYEYHRTATDTALFEGTLTDAALTTYHPALIGGQLDTVLDGARRREIGLTRYLNQKEVDVSHAWGFTLGFDKWSIFGKNRKDLDTIQRVDEAKRQQIAYAGFGRYEDNTNTWGVDFKADMSHFSASPRLSDYEFGMHVSLVKPSQTFTDADRLNAIDHAIAWSICPESHRDWLASRLPALGTRNVEWSFHVRVNQEGFRDMLPVMANMARSDFAAAFASGMMPEPTNVLPVSTRIGLYTPIWRALLSDDPPTSLSDVASLASRALARVNPAQSNLERTTGQNTASTVCGIYRMETAAAIANDLDEWIRGVKQWADATQKDLLDRNLIPSIYRKLNNFFLESLYVRALGAHLIDVSRRANQIKGVERTLNVKVGDSTLIVSANDFAAA